MKEEREGQASRSFEFLSYEPKASSLPATDPNLSVKHNGFWSYGGPSIATSDDLPPDFYEFTTAVLSSSLLPRLIPLLNYFNQVLRDHGLDHYWLTIRATKATTEFDRPRWHTDDLFFNSSGGGLKTAPQRAQTGESKDRQLDLHTDWKLCATLLGPPTKFIPPERQSEARDTQRAVRKALATEHSCISIRCVACAATADAVRERLMAELEPMGVTQAAPTECTFFRIGHDKGAVHSEPPMSGVDRIFVNVVPGTKDELGTLFSRWGMSFPRSWWIAPTVPRTLQMAL